MGFDDLENAIEEQDEAETDDTEASRSTREFTAAVDETADVQEDVDDKSEPSTEPAFGFDEAKQDPLYARRQSWEAFDDMLDLDLERELRDRDIRDVPKREKHDAVLRFVADHAEEIADRIESERS